MVLTKGWKARTDRKWAVYRGVKEILVDARLGAYEIRPHRVYGHYLKKVLRILEPTHGRLVVVLHGLGIERQPKRGRQRYRSRGWDR